MSRLAVIRTAGGGVMRHRAQAVVIGVVLLVSTASATLGFTLLAAIDAPYQHAFDARRGAHAAITVDTARAGPRRPAATGTLPGVTAVAGPFAVATVQLRYGGVSLGPRTLAGRASPGGPVDNVVLSEGHWPDRPGQLVLDAGPGGGAGYPGLGDAVTATGPRGVHTLTVTGFATSITRTADGWVTPAQAGALGPQGASATAQLLVRFADAGTDARIRRDVAEVARALPSGAVAGSTSWLTTERNAAGNAALMEPFLLAFALIGLVLAVLIVANVVSGAVVAQYHRIGVLKSIGLTPGQIVAVYLNRIGHPALAGCLAGVAAGNLLAVPVLRASSGIYGVGRQQVPWWASVAALAGMLALTVLAALGPAVRAGRLSAVQAITTGRAPRARRGYAAHRLTARLPLPRPVGIGLAAPFARPTRTLMTLAAIAAGATAVIFAAGLNTALGRAEQAQTLATTAPVDIRLADPHADADAAQDATVTAALHAQPGTRHYVAVYGRGAAAAVEVPGIAQPIDIQAFGGDASWLGYAVITGRWYRAPDEVDVNTAFLTDSGLAVGDTTTLDTPGAAPVTVRIVGEVFAPSGNPWLLTGAQTLPGLATPGNLEGYDIGLGPGTDTTAYIRAVNTALRHGTPWQAAVPSGNQFYGIATGLLGLLALMVAVAAGLGVLNTVLMSTRDRVHDLGILKALGMRPGQLLTMVLCQVAAPAVAATAIAVPTAIALTTATVHAMAAAKSTRVPAGFTDVFPASQLALLSLGAFAIALAGALLPSSWAARARSATALRTE
ncbi:FtsX-like permease family protein [Streptomyces sp. NPDC048277]|uniref:ABC transporter permease n=1 Tax=Streptomyces sp. NPDC048277 TaxID=3155027 RepID=UPI0033DD30AC